MNRLVILLSTSLILQSLPAFAQQEMGLEEFLKLAAQENLDLKIEKAKTDAAEAKSVGLAIPPPMIGINQMKEENGTSSRGFEVSQTIPFPTKLTSNHSARKDEAEAQKQMQAANRNETLSNAKLLFISLWAKQERVSLLKEKNSVIQDHIKLARSTARSDSFAAIHLLKAESERDLLENEILSATQDLKEARIQAATLLNSDPEKLQFTADEPPLSGLPKTSSLENTPQLQSLRLNLESAKSRETEAISSWFPDISLRYKQMGQTSMAGPYNEVMVGITLPFVFFWEPSSEKSQASSARIQKEYEFEKERRTIQNKKEALLSRATSLKEQIENLNSKLIPRAEKRMRAVHNLAPRDMETLQDHRETMEAFPDLKMKALDLRIQYEEVIAELGKYFGESAL